jgi:carotenoid cleavage dioxygenase-like enzyme
MPRPRIACYALLLGALGVALPAAAEDRPEGFEQILKRGNIGAINDPVYVAAADARIPDDAWVLGFVIDDRAFAYSVNLLNAHEVVNDEVGGQPFAAVW